MAEGLVLHCKALVQQKCTLALLPVSAKSLLSSPVPFISLFPPGLCLRFHFSPQGYAIHFTVPPQSYAFVFTCLPQGYAFVQFTSPFDARSACLGEDAKSLCGQTLDVNMVSEPKAHISKVKKEQRN